MPSPRRVLSDEIAHCRVLVLVAVWKEVVGSAEVATLSRAQFSEVSRRVEGAKDDEEASSGGWDPREGEGEAPHATARSGFLHEAPAASSAPVWGGDANGGTAAAAAAAAGRQSDTQTD